MALALLVVAMSCAFCAGVFGHLSWQIRSDERRADPHSLTLTALLMLLGAAFFISGVTA